jgi:hypothetical protein
MGAVDEAQTWKSEELIWMSERARIELTPREIISKGARGVPSPRWKMRCPLAAKGQRTNITGSRLRAAKWATITSMLTSRSNLKLHVEANWVAITSLLISQSNLKLLGEI